MRVISALKPPLLRRFFCCNCSTSTQQAGRNVAQGMPLGAPASSRPRNELTPGTCEKPPGWRRSDLTPVLAECLLFALAILYYVAGTCKKNEKPLRGCPKTSTRRLLVFKLVRWRRRRLVVCPALQRYLFQKPGDDHGHDGNNCHTDEDAVQRAGKGDFAVSGIAGC